MAYFINCEYSSCRTSNENEPPVYVRVYRVPCIDCGETTRIQIPEREFQLYRGGKLMQDVFPTFDVGIRELMISGVCPKCWDKMFSPEEVD